jgi:hypothetical protein
VGEWRRLLHDAPCHSFRRGCGECSLSHIMQLALRACTAAAAVAAGVGAAARAAAAEVVSSGWCVCVCVCVWASTAAPLTTAGAACCIMILPQVCGAALPPTHVALPVQQQAALTSACGGSTRGAGPPHAVLQSCGHYGHHGAKAAAVWWSAAQWRVACHSSAELTAAAPVPALLFGTPVGHLGLHAASWGTGTS